LGKRQRDLNERRHRKVRARREIILAILPSRAAGA
jgi:hypothetical protein